jgi:hypothetical protein
MLRAVQGRTAIFDGCKPLKMGAIRKPRCRTGRPNAAERKDARERRSNDDVEKAMDGFFNKQLRVIRYACVQVLRVSSAAVLGACGPIFD